MQEYQWKLEQEVNGVLWCVEDSLEDEQPKEPWQVKCEEDCVLEQVSVVILPSGDAGKKRQD